MIDYSKLSYPYPYIPAEKRAGLLPEHNVCSIAPAEEPSDDFITGCGSLRQIRIPASVTEIADSAFEDCPEDLMIFGAGGSRAEYFANTHGFRFVEE